jgi:hypothetical protein
MLPLFFLSCALETPADDADDKPAVTQADVLFTVADATSSHSLIQFKGSVTDWQALPMFDNGTHGDLSADDHIWSLFMPQIKSGTWGVMDEKGAWLITGENLAYTIKADGSVGGQTTFEIPKVTTADILFTVADGTATHTVLKFNGSAVSWIPQLMYDDGTHGDLTAGDHTWSLLLTGVKSGTWGVLDEKNTWMITGSSPSYTVEDNGNITGQTHYTIPAKGPSTDVTFRVIDKTALLAGIQFKGSATGWTLSAMKDDGTGGDVTADDHIWTVIIKDISSGVWGATDSKGSWLIKGPNLSYTVNEDKTVTGVTDYTIE